MLNTKQQEFVDYAVEKFGTAELTVAELKEANAHFGCKYAPQWLIKNADYKVGKSTFRLPTESNMVSTPSNVKEAVPETEKVLTTKAPETATVSEAAYVVSSLTGDIVPKKDPVFVSFGNYPDVKSIVKSKMFYPVFITGLSGNGKTMGVTQACAENKRELIRVNITIETDEDDLLGGYRLKDGQTVWQNGPVIEAMERGAVLLLDEIISTRRLVHIIQAYAIFGKKMKAVEVCTNRFDDDTKNSFIELYTKVDAGATAEQISEEARQADMSSQMDDNDSESDDEDAI